MTLIVVDNKATNNLSIHDWGLVNYETLSPSKMEDSVFLNFMKSRKSYNYHKVISSYV